MGKAVAGRMAPRYAQDQLASKTQQLAFPSADGLLTDAVARCIDVLPPRGAAGVAFAAMTGLALVLAGAAYYPSMLFVAADRGVGSSASGALRALKVSWGSSCFAAAIACNALKTAADRGHLARPANRQLSGCMSALLASTASALASGARDGALAPGAAPP